MARIDLGGDDSQDDLAEALRQLEQQQEKAAEPEEAAEKPPADVEAARGRARRERESEHKRSRQDIQGAVEAIRERQAAERAVGRKKAGPARWIALGVVLVVLIAAGILFLRPEPLPPPAATPEGAVRGFWDAIAQQNYPGATVFYPALVDRYGSRKQAALYLADRFEKDPVTKVTVGEAAELPESEDLRVSYEVWRRSGRPTPGEFIVRDSGSEETGYVVITGP
ncbi:MAG: hypothetical protein MUQ65_13510 [Armatimonadetes bacterium]|nr:hypothetical protein [Armatimonadota bacterium]